VCLRATIVTPRVRLVQCLPELLPEGLGQNSPQKSQGGKFYVTVDWANADGRSGPGRSQVVRTQ